MPIAADLVVNNGASTPMSKTFTLLAPASGNGGIAEWALKEGTISTIFPKFTASANVNNSSSSRNVKLKFRLPSSYTDSVTGLTSVSSSFEGNVSVTVPNDFPESLKNDAVAFFTNLLSTTLVKAMIRDGLSAT